MAAATRTTLLFAVWWSLVSAQDNETATLAPNLLLEEPLCGYSKRNIDEDPLRRHCLRQCILGDDGIVYPYFEEWEGQLGRGQFSCPR